LIKIMGINLTDILRNNSTQGMNMMDDLMIPDERILRALFNSGILDNLRDFEINVLASLLTIKYFEPGMISAELNDVALKNALMILIEGEIDISATVNNELVTLHLEAPGDMARIMSFVGGTGTNISAAINVRKNSAVLVLQRSKLETLMHSHPSIAYYVMRNLVGYVHGVARRRYAENEQLSNYLFSMNGRY